MKLWCYMSFHILICTVLGLHNFSLQATIDRHWPFLYSVIILTLSTVEKKYCNDSKIMEFKMIDTENSTAYVIIYKLITYLFVD